MVTQNVFDGRGTERVPHKYTMKGIGRARTLAEATLNEEKLQLIKIPKKKVGNYISSVNCS